MPALGGALLAWGIFTAAVQGLADVEYTQARLLLGPAGQDRPPPAPAQVAAARRHLRAALEWDSGNPHYAEQFARAEELRALALDPKDPAARQALRQAAAALRLAARERPGSAYTWADLARVKLRLDDLDFEFYGALERATRLGPWEFAVQIALIDVGLAAWRLLPPAATGMVVGALDRALLREPGHVDRLAARHGTLPQVCARPNLPARLAARCVRK